MYYISCLSCLEKHALARWLYVRGVKVIDEFTPDTMNTMLELYSYL